MPPRIARVPSDRSTGRGLGVPQQCARRPLSGQTTTALPANPRLSPGRDRTVSGGSISNHPTSVVSCRCCCIPGIATVIRSAARSNASASMRVADRLRRLAVPLEPVARPEVQLVDTVGQFVEQAGTQHLGEEVVIAVPLAMVVERNEKQVRPVQGLERAVAPATAGDRIAEVAGQPREDRRLEQERPHRLRLPMQHLFDQVVDDVPVVAGEPRDERSRVVAPLHRQGGELDRRDPSLRALTECDDIIVARPRAP